MTISILKTKCQPAELHTSIFMNCQTPKSEHVEAVRSVSQDLELPKIAVQHELKARDGLAVYATYCSRESESMCHLRHPDAS